MNWILCALVWFGAFLAMTFSVTSRGFKGLQPMLKKVMPEMGERWSGETSSLILYPPAEMQASYLDFSLRFINVNMIKNIACIYVQILKKNSDGSLVQLFEGYYKPRTGNNKIRNYLLQKNTERRVGYFWKNDFGVNDYPKYEYLRFSINP